MNSKHKRVSTIQFPLYKVQKETNLVVEMGTMGRKDAVARKGHEGAAGAINREILFLALDASYMAVLTS